jgi:hypothetical protein
MAFSAPRTRSRLSATALSGRPTMVRAGIPGPICTCTSIGRAFEAHDHHGAWVKDRISSSTSWLLPTVRETSVILASSGQWPMNQVS